MPALVGQEESRAFLGHSVAQNRQNSTESGEISWSFLRVNPFFRNGSNPLLDQTRQISFPWMPFDPGTLEHIDFCWEELGHEVEQALLLGQFSTIAEMKFRRQENSLHTTARKTGNLVGLTQHMAHPRLPGPRPATQGSEATVWTSEHHHESTGDRAKGFYYKPCILPNTGGTGVSGLRRTATSNRSSKGTLKGSP